MNQGAASVALTPYLLQVSPSLIQQLLDLGGWGALMFGVATLLFALFKAEPWIYTSGRYKAEKARADSFEEKYIELLKSDLQEMKDRDRTLEMLSRLAEKGEASRE